MFTIGGLSGVTHAVSPGRHPADRHLLHRRPLPLRALRWRRPRLLRRLLLLVAEGLRQHAQRDARQVELLADAHRLQPDLRADAHPRPAGQPRRMYVWTDQRRRRVLQPRFWNMVVHDRRFIIAVGVVPVPRQRRPSTGSARRSPATPARPVGRPHARVDDRRRPPKEHNFDADPDRARARRVLAPQVRGGRGDRRARARSPPPRRSSPSRRRTPTSTSTCRRRRTGRSCSPFGLPIIAYGLIFSRWLSRGRRRHRGRWPSSAGRSSRPDAPTAITTTTTTRRTVASRRSRAGEPTEPTPTSSGARRPSEVEHRWLTPQSIDHGRRRVRRRPHRARHHHRALQQEAGDVAVPRLGVPAVRRPHLHLPALPDGRSRAGRRRRTRSTTSRSPRSARSCC